MYKVICKINTVRRPISCTAFNNVSNWISEISHIIAFVTVSRPWKVKKKTKSKKKKYLNCTLQSTLYLSSRGTLAIRFGLHVYRGTPKKLGLTWCLNQTSKSFLCCIFSAVGFWQTDEIRSFLCWVHVLCHRVLRHLPSVCQTKIHYFKLRVCY